MNFAAIGAFILKYIETNPQAVESLIGALINLFAAQPALLHQAVQVTIKKIDATLPPPPVSGIK